MPFFRFLQDSTASFNWPTFNDTNQQLEMSNTTTMETIPAIPARHSSEENSEGELVGMMLGVSIFWVLATLVMVLVVYIFKYGKCPGFVFTIVGAIKRKRSEGPDGEGKTYAENGGIGDTTEL